jgi:hypothetical protein
MTSSGGFVWPKSGRVEAPDWNPDPVCGGGLHGLLDGDGDGNVLDWGDAAIWLVCEIDEHVNLNGKVKFPSANVVYCGDRQGATMYIRRVDERNVSAIVGITLTGGDHSTLTGGDHSTLTGGDESILTGGDESILTGGDRSILTGGDESILTWRVWDGRYYRIHDYYVGENGLTPDTPYIFADGEIKEHTT